VRSSPSIAHVVRDPAPGSGSGGGTRIAALEGMRIFGLAIAAGLVACQTGVDDHRGPIPVAPDRPDPALVLEQHMRDNYDLARGIEGLLIRGNVADTVGSARLIAIAPVPPGSTAWANEAAAASARATDLADAPGLDEALRRYARLAAACAACHRAAGASTEFGVVEPVPPDADTVEARMARHLWATARLWDGAIGGDEAAWRAGLTVLAATPAPWRDLTDRASYARRLQELAGTALRDAGGDVLERTRVHGELLVVCAACHSIPTK
jgi:cytochrome c553